MNENDPKIGENHKPKKKIILSFENGQWVSKFKENGDFITVRDMNQLRRVLRVGFRLFTSNKRMEQAKANAKVI